MGIINNFFGNRSEADHQSAIHWINLNNIEDIEGMIEQSELNTVIVFKHSNRCGISSSVLRRFEKQAGDLIENKSKFYLLNIIEHRNISNEISQKFSIHHESPQLIIIKRGKIVAYDSHYEILNIDISGY